ncbi:MAG: hypothetical protein LQ351_003019 [Letrouitia transgressa]|nr:MAG: hypothetical protein LQ351_003019 [Letrouitia transgressa]
MSGYAYPPPQQSQTTEQYRASPTGSTVSLPSLSLPPIRTMDGRPQSQQGGQQQQAAPSQHQPQGTQPSISAALPPPMSQYYQNQSLPPQQHINVTSDPNQPMRYPIPIPPTENRVMSGGRHKKEIKRRTKTGCLTCRRRRIKCDEGHPSCRNCQKSKRECLGYDPIFKAQPGPTAIQPAPTAAPAMQTTPASSSPFSAAQQGYALAGSQTYASPGLPANANPSNPATDASFYGNAIDPALGGADNTSSYPSNVPGDNHRAKRSKVEDLLALGGAFPPPITATQPLQYDEIKHLYQISYAPGLDKFFETNWFRAKGINHLTNDSRICELIATLLSRVTLDTTNVHFYHDMAVNNSLEANILWLLMALPRSVANASKPSNGQANNVETSDGVLDAANRVEIFENLVLGQYLDVEVPINKEGSRNGTTFDNQLKSREHEFWRLMSKFLTLRDDEASSAKEIDDTLTACRGLLESRENRDVIYSIAIARHLGQRMSEFPDNLSQPSNNSETDPKGRLLVAKDFLEGEAKGKGTNQVIQRLCGIAVRSWTVR